MTGPDIVLIYTGARHFDDQGTRSAENAGNASDARKALRYCNPIAPSSVLLRREAVLAAGGFREGTPSCEDWGMWVSLMPFGQFAVVPEALTNYYVSPMSMSASPEKMLDGLRAILDPVLLADTRGIRRWARRRRIWAQQLCSAALIARENRLQGELGYIFRSLLSWPSPFWKPRRFAIFATSFRHRLLSRREMP